MPAPGGYWLPRPARIASAAAMAISAGPSVSGKPWPRLTEPVATASSDISAKIVVPNPASARLSSGRFTQLSDHELWRGDPGGRPPGSPATTRPTDPWGDFPVPPPGNHIDRTVAP